MNEEKKKKFEELNLRCDGAYGCGKFPPEVWQWIEQKLKEAYLLGAKDAIEAVKIELHEKYNQVEYKKDRYGYLMAMTDTKFKAQQFLDSLEKEDGNPNI